MALVNLEGAVSLANVVVMYTVVSRAESDMETENNFDVTTTGSDR